MDLRTPFARVRALFRRSALERDLADEVEAHLDLLEQDFRRRGLSPAAARAAARRSFGGVEAMKERYRDRRSIPMIETTLQDLRYAVRIFRKSPVFTVVAVLSIALGIGANTAIFTLLDQIVLRLLPVKDPRELVLVTAQGRQYGDGRGVGDELSYPRYADLRDHNDVFTGMCARSSVFLQVSAGGRSERALGELVSGTYFPTLGLRAHLGRLFGPEDDRPSGDHAVAVLSHAYWMARFGGASDILGQSIVVNNHPITIVGVIQEGFQGTDRGVVSQIFFPLTYRDLLPTAEALENRRLRWLTVFARLRPGITAEEAQTRLQPFYAAQLQMEVNEAAFARASAATKAAFVHGTVSVTSAGAGRSRFRTTLTRPLWILMTIVGCVLLIACANVANLLIARASVRQREIALRLTLGATRSRIVRQLLIESLVLAAIGGVFGLAIAVWGSSLLLAVFRDANADVTVTASPDLRILAFNLVLSLLTGVLFGVMPARQATRPALAPTLKNEAGSVIGGSQGTLRKVLVASQVALSLLLLIGAGLFIRSLHNLLSIDSGIETSRLLSFAMAPGLNGYHDARASQFRSALLDRIRATPGVESAGIGGYPLLTGGSWNNSISVEGRTPSAGPMPFAMENGVGPGYFATMGMHIVAGRDFGERDLQLGVPDRDQTIRVAIANQTFARRFLSDGAIGRHVGIGGDPGTPTPIEIIGVVSDAKYTSQREETPPQLFYPYGNGDFMNVYVRTTGDPSAMFQTLRRIAAEIDPNVAVYAMETFQAKIDRSLVTERLVGALSTVFGLLATMLAMIGLYGVMAYSVTRRTREIGVRMALGARTRQVMWLVLREAGTLVAIGVLIGLPAAWFASRYIESQLYGVTPTDPAVLAAAVLGLTVVAGAAGLIPARRAARVDPTIALRYE